MPTPEELALQDIFGESPPPGPGEDDAGGAAAIAELLSRFASSVPRPSPQIESAGDAFDPSFTQNAPSPQQPARAPTPQQPASAPTLTPDMIATIESMPGFRASGLPVEFFTTFLSPDALTTGKFNLDKAAFTDIARFIRQTAEDNRKTGEREAKESEEAAVDPNAALRTQQLQGAVDLQQQRLAQEDLPKSLDQIMTKAILEDDFELARRINDFKKEPSNAEKLRLAIDFASSPADVFSLSAIADGVFPGQFDKFEGIRSLPKSPFAQDLFDSVFGVNQPAPERRQPTTAAPNAPAPVAEPAPLDSFRSPESGGVPLQPQPFSQPDAALPPRDATFDDFTFSTGDEDLGDPIGRFLQGQPFDPSDVGSINRFLDAGVPTAAPQPVPEPSAFPGDTRQFDESLPGEVSRRFPANESLERSGQLPGIDPLAPPPAPPGNQPFQGAPLQDIQAQGLPERRPGDNLVNRAPARGVIPEGVPTFTTKFDGQDRRLPVRFGTLFRGIKDPSEQLQRPKSFLGAVGLPRLDPGTFSRLSAGEQDAFIRLSQETGLDPRDVQREIESGRPSQPRFSRITSAATRSR